MAGLFDPIRIRKMELKNRIMVSPMCQYSAENDAMVNDWHVVHYGSFALGGPALIVTEATAVEERGRISPNDLGIYSDAHLSGLRKLVDFAHQHGVKMGIQLAHAGRKAQLSQPIIAPSSIRFSESYQVPEEASLETLHEVLNAFVLGAKRAVEVGFDCIELHVAHGYLLHQFLSPISNQRTDEYGGSWENRLRYPLEVVKAVRVAIPQEMPLFVRVSGSEYSHEGYTMDEMVQFCSAFREAGVDLIDVSSGGNLPIAPPQIYAGYQVPLAESIRSRSGIAVASVGMLEDPILADSILRQERADMIVIARGFLRDKHWGHSAAIALKQPVHPPKAYERAYL